MRNFSMLPYPGVTGIFLLLVLLLSGCGAVDSLERAWARQELKRAFKQAHRDQDPQALMDLYFLDGVRPEDRVLLRIAAREEVVLPLQSLQFSQPEPETTIHYTFEGQVYEPTLPVDLEMAVQYSNPDYLKVTYLLGYNRGKFYLVTARPTRNSSSQAL